MDDARDLDAAGLKVDDEKHDMVMASLAWSLKAWFGLLLPEKGRWASK